MKQAVSLLVFLIGGSLLLQARAERVVGLNNAAVAGYEISFKGCYCVGNIGESSIEPPRCSSVEHFNFHVHVRHKLQYLATYDSKLYSAYMFSQEYQRSSPATPTTPTTPTTSTPDSS